MHPADLFRIQRTQKRKLQQHLRRALGVRTRVAQHDLTAGTGHHRGERTTADALDAPAEQGRAGQQRPCVARRNQRIPLAAFQQFERHCHGRIRFAAQHGCRIIMHIHQIGRRHDMQAGLFRHPLGLEDLRNRLRTANQHNLLAELLCRQRTAPNGGLRRMIAAHGVHNDPHVKAPLSNCRSLQAPARKFLYSSPAFP